MKKCLLAGVCSVFLVLPSARAAEEGKVALGGGLEIGLLDYWSLAGFSETLVVGADYFSLGIRVSGEYGITKMISSGIEIIPTLELKETQDLTELPIILYGKTSAGPGYAKIGLAIDYWRDAEDVDIGINLGFGISHKISDKLSLEGGIELTPYFKVVDIRLPINLRLGVSFGL